MRSYRPSGHRKSRSAADKIPIKYRVREAWRKYAPDVPQQAHFEDAVAQPERAVIAERTKSGMKAAKVRGRFADDPVLDDVVQIRRNAKAARHLRSRLMKKQGCLVQRIIQRFRSPGALRCFVSVFSRAEISSSPHAPNTQPSPRKVQVQGPTSYRNPDRRLLPSSLVLAARRTLEVKDALCRKGRRTAGPGTGNPIGQKLRL